MKIMRLINTINNTAVWLILLGITFLTYMIGGLGLSGNTVVVVLLAGTILKGVLIIRNFMELQGVSLLWRVIMYGWLWVVCGVIAVVYFFAN